MYLFKIYVDSFSSKNYLPFTLPLKCGFFPLYSFTSLTCLWVVAFLKVLLTEKFVFLYPLISSPYGRQLKYTDLVINTHIFLWWRLTSKAYPCWSEVPTLGHIFPSNCHLPIWLQLLVLHWSCCPVEGDIYPLLTFFSFCINPSH